MSAWEPCRFNTPVSQSRVSFRYRQRPPQSRGLTQVVTNQRLGNLRPIGIRTALQRRARDELGLEFNENTMKKVREIIESDEPIGIIISRGDRKEVPPIFSAYIWGPAPEPVADKTTRVA